MKTYIGANALGARYGAALGLGIAVALALFALLASVAHAAEIDGMVAEFSILKADRAAFRAPGTGQQVYRCAGAGTAYAWQLIGVDAKLLDDEGKTFATQSLDAFDSLDGSHVASAVSQTVAAPTPGALPDLLYAVSAKSTSGLFYATTYVVRSDAAGGLAPAQPCDASLSGRIVRVPFKAEYTFFEAR